MYTICLPGGSKSEHSEVGIALEAVEGGGGDGGILSIAPLSNGVENVRQPSTGSFAPGSNALGLQALRKSDSVIGIASGGFTKKHIFGCNPDTTHSESTQYGWLPIDAQSLSVLHCPTLR